MRCLAADQLLGWRCARSTYLECLDQAIITARSQELLSCKKHQGNAVETYTRQSHSWSILWDSFHGRCARKSRTRKFRFAAWPCLQLCAARCLYRSLQPDVRHRCPPPDLELAPHRQLHQTHTYRSGTLTFDARPLAALLGLSSLPLTFSK